MTVERQDRCPLCGTISGSIVGEFDEKMEKEIGEYYVCNNVSHGVFYWPTELELPTPAQLERK